MTENHDHLIWQYKAANAESRDCLLFDRYILVSAIAEIHVIMNDINIPDPHIILSIKRQFYLI